MFLGKKTRLEDCILAALKNGPLNIVDLISLLHTQNQSSTKQGGYYAIRQLKKQEAVVVQKGVISINISWLNEVNSYVLAAQQHYLGAQQRTGHVAALKEGEKIQYSFTDSLSTDVFWNHIIHILTSFIDPSHPFIAFNPHCWYYFYSDNEVALRDSLTATGRQYLITVNGKTPLDKYIQNQFDGEKSQYYMAGKTVFPQQNYCFNIIGDFIIEVWLDMKTQQRIDQFYDTIDVFTADTKAIFQDILKERGCTRLVVSRNKKKARRLEKKLLRNFYIPHRD